MPNIIFYLHNQKLLHGELSDNEFVNNLKYKYILRNLLFKQ